MRKILKQKQRFSGYAEGKIGLSLGLLDKNNNVLSVGDKVVYGKYIGRILYNHHYGMYGVALNYSMWYGDDEFNIDSYGKFVSIPMDNGAKMELECLDV